MRLTYEDLIAKGTGDPFDRHIFACALCVAMGDGTRPVTEALGLGAEPLTRVLRAYFPQMGWLSKVVPAGAGAGEDALEEPDLRRLLLDHRTAGADEEEWLAAIVARRSLGPNHLWQDLGLFDRGELGRLLHRHFRPLALQNLRDMKWKKFFYRQLCERDGVLICKAPNCEICDDFAVCFGSEDDEPLADTRRSLLERRQS